MAVPKDIRDTLIQEATQAFENSYSPYSKFRIGAAIYTEDGDIFTGCNIENISYGLTCCGERTAAFKMISEKGPNVRIQYIAIATEADIPCSPCGMCRQVIAEFGSEAIVIFKGDEGYQETSISTLLPGNFKEFVATSEDGHQTLIQPGM